MLSARLARALTVLVGAVYASDGDFATSALLFGDHCLSSSQDCGLSLVQLRAQQVDTENGHRRETCSELANHGSFFSVEIQAGTPSQKFDVVADTGSDAVIIPSCLCQESGECGTQDRCFRGTNKSTTFTIPTTEVPMVSMEFGSGTIAAAVSTDVVKVGSVSATMDQGLLLMVDRKLDIQGPFEGILGLGQLQSEYQGEGSKAEENDEEDRADWDVPKAVKKSKKAEQAMPIPGFLRSAGVDRFSICFNDGVSPGVLRMNTPKQPKLLPSVGTMHWGLEFSGMSIGKAKSPAIFCGPDSKAPSCGAIPDSGTTVMLGPESQVRTLFASICEQWPRCQKESTSKKFKGAAKEEIFQRVLMDCESWLGEEGGKGLDELPTIYMHLGGANGNQSVALSGWSYIFEAAIEEMEQHSKLLGNIGISALKETKPSKKSNSTSSTAYACTPAFGASDLPSNGGGDVWILGTPLFYEYVVNYDLGASPPSMGFSIEPCGSCSVEAAMLIAQKQQDTSRQDRRAPRRIRGPLRVGRHTTKRHASRSGKAFA